MHAEFVTFQGKYLLWKVGRRLRIKAKQLAETRAVKRLQTQADEPSARAVPLAEAEHPSLALYWAGWKI